MRDHIGGGFIVFGRCAWRVPHFEKMLYDQAQLVLAYVEAAQASADPFYIEVAEDTLRYVMREMTSAEGAFYSAEDADSVPPERANDPAPRKSEALFTCGATQSSTTFSDLTQRSSSGALVSSRRQCTVDRSKSLSARISYMLPVASTTWRATSVSPRIRSRRSSTARA